jgi:hypothetical protein
MSAYEMKPGVDGCPQCGGIDIAVTDSRHWMDSGWRRRLRRCNSCLSTFVTLEVPQELITNAAHAFVPTLRVTDPKSRKRPPALLPTAAAGEGGNVSD